MLDEGNLEDKSVPYYLSLDSCTAKAVPHRKSSPQLWTVSDDTVPYTSEHRTITLPVFIPQS